MPTDHTADASSERSDLVETLVKHRKFLCQTVRGLSDEQASLRPTASQLCLGGIVKHLTRVEMRWCDFILDGPGAMGGGDQPSYEAHAASFLVGDEETVADLLVGYEHAAKRTDDLVQSLPSLDASQPLPEAPWFEPGVRWSARRVFLHIIAETSQHAGHADIIRESIDGAKTMG